MSTNMCFTMLSLFCALLFTFVAADDNTHTYAADEAVTLWVNTIGPFHNPTEIYAYYGTCSICLLFGALPFIARETLSLLRNTSTRSLGTAPLALSRVILPVSRSKRFPHCPP